MMSTTRVMDIVPELIANHTKFFQKYPWQFRLQDIVEQPAYDTIVCRMMLQHLFTRDVLTVLKKFSFSGSCYLLTTTFYTIGNNSNDLSKRKRQQEDFGVWIWRFRKYPYCLRNVVFEIEMMRTREFLGLEKLPTAVLDNLLNWPQEKCYSCTEWGCNLWASSKILISDFRRSGIELSIPNSVISVHTVLQSHGSEIGYYL